MAIESTVRTSAATRQNKIATVSMIPIRAPSLTVRMRVEDRVAVHLPDWFGPGVVVQTVGSIQPEDGQVPTAKANMDGSCGSSSSAVHSVGCFSRKMGTADGRGVIR